MLISRKSDRGFYNILVHTISKYLKTSYINVFSGDTFSFSMCKYSPDAEHIYLDVPITYVYKYNEGEETVTKTKKNIEILSDEEKDDSDNEYANLKPAQNSKNKQPYVANRKISENLSEKRRIHTEGVRKTAVMLAEKYGEDVDKAEVAALCHDMYRGINIDLLNDYVNQLGLDIERA